MNNAELKEIISEVTLLMNLAGCIGDDDTLEDYKNEVWEHSKRIREMLINLSTVESEQGHLPNKLKS